MTTVDSPRRSFWAWCLESEEPTSQQRDELATKLSERAGTEIVASPIPHLEDAALRPPRIKVPDALAAWCTTETWERAFHAHGAHFTDRTRAFNLEFPNPPDVVAHPTSEAELAATVDWCGGNGHVIVPFGGGSSVVWGVNPPEADVDRDHRARSPRSRARDRRDVAGGPHPGGSPRPSARRSAAAARLHAAPLPAVVSLLLARRVDRHSIRRPLRHEPHAHRRLRRVGTHADPAGLVGVAAAARQRCWSVTGPNGDRQRRDPRHHQRSVDAHPAEAGVPSHRRGHVRLMGGRLRSSARRRPGEALAGELAASSILPRLTGRRASTAPRHS